MTTPEPIAPDERPLPPGMYVDPAQVPTSLSERTMEPAQPVGTPSDCQDPLGVGGTHIKHHV
jgi:hypothetical protein